MRQDRGFCILTLSLMRGITQPAKPASYTLPACDMRNFQGSHYPGDKP
jgi:hypothetical protein